jgi:hypothetical protein
MWLPFLPSAHLGTSARWERPELKARIDPGEELLWTDIAMTGILGHPWVRSMPVMWGSGFWDVAITNNRLLAVELPIIRILKREWKANSLRWSEVVGCELRIYTSTGSVLCEVTTASGSMCYKMIYAAFDIAAITRALRSVLPNVVVKSGLIRPA